MLIICHLEVDFSSFPHCPKNVGDLRRDEPLDSFSPSQTLYLVRNWGPEDLCKAIRFHLPQMVLWPCWQKAGSPVCVQNQYPILCSGKVDLNLQQKFSKKIKIKNKTKKVNSIEELVMD